MLTRRPGLRPIAFTLIELLVVVAIIALLISILLPSLSSARKQAKVTKCAAQLHDIGVSLMSYNTETRRFPNQNAMGDQNRARSEREGPGFWGYSVHQQLARYMGGLQMSATDPNVLSRTHAVFYCPFAPPEAIDFADVLSGPGTGYGVQNTEEVYMHISYTYFGALHENGNDPAKVTTVGSAADEGLASDIRKKRKDYVRNEPDGGKVLMSDTVMAWFGGAPPKWRINHGEGWKQSPIAGSPWQPPRIESANLMYGDGHVEKKGPRHFRELTSAPTLMDARRNATLRFGGGVPVPPFQGDCLWW